MATYELPCGYIDPETQELVTEVELEEMTGFEEDILGDKTKRGKATDEVLARCLKRVGQKARVDKEGSRGLTFNELVKDLLSPDRTFLMIRLREMSLGARFTFPAPCPNCKYRNEAVTVLLDELEVKPMEDPERREWEVEIPSGKMVQFRALTGRDEQKLQRLVKERKGNFFSGVLNLRITTIDGDRVKLVDLKRLSTKDRDFLRKKFDEVEGGIDTKIDIECEDCGQEFNMILPVGEETFFFPSGMRV